MTDKPRRIRDGLVPYGPLDTYNGVRVSSFCEACRDGIARLEHGMQKTVDLCTACAGLLAPHCTVIEHPAMSAPVDHPKEDASE